MRLLFFIAAFAASIAHAQKVDPAQDCHFVSWWANKAFHIARTVGLDADKWTITEEGFPPDAYAIIMDIKREAYTDLDALRKRVDLVCAAKEAT